MKPIDTGILSVLRNACLAASVLWVSGVAATQAQTSPRDFGPPYGQGRPVNVVVVQQPAQPVTMLSPVPVVAMAPAVSSVVTAYPPASPLQVAFYSATPATCGLPAAQVVVARPVSVVPAPYTVNYAPVAGGPVAWPSVTPSFQPGNTIYGSPTLYGYGQPVRNVMRSMVP
jgi:hypothetical protein